MNDTQHEPTELECTFPQGIQNARDALIYLSRWHDTKFEILSPDNIKVESGNFRFTMTGEELTSYARKLFAAMEEEHAQAVKRYERFEIEFAQRDRVENTIIGGLALFLFVAAVLFFLSQAFPS